MSLSRRERAEDEGHLDTAQALDRQGDPAPQAPRLDRDRLELHEQRAGRVGAITHLPADCLGGDDPHRLEDAQLAGHGGRGKAGAPRDLADVEAASRVREQQADDGFAGATQQGGAEAG